MGILYMNTADVGDMTLWQSWGANGTISATQARTGTKAFYINTSDGWFVAAIASKTAGYARVCTYCTGGLTTYDRIQVRLREGTANHLVFRCNPTTGVATLYRGAANTLIASESLNVPGENVWTAWEIYWNIHASTGNCHVKANGLPVITFNGNTSNGDLAVVNNLYIGNDSLNVVGYVYYDDIIIRDDQWPYRGGIHVLVPDADGDESDWTKSDVGKDFDEHLSPLPAAFDDYLSADVTVAGLKQLTNLTSLGADVWNIRGVGVHAQAKSTVSTDAFIRTLLQPADVAADLEVGSDFGIESAASWARTFYSVNPHDSAVWEKADVDDVQVGFETRVPA